MISTIAEILSWWAFISIPVTIYLVWLNYRKYSIINKAIPDETKSLEGLVDFVSIYKPKLITIGKNCKLRELKEFDTSSRRYWKFFRGVPIKYLDK